MSAFLGPIHYWLYNKIKIQDSIVDKIVLFAEKENQKSDLRTELDNQFGSLNLRPLEEIIDTTNIHGWLQQCVSMVEYRLAYAVTDLLKINPDYIEDVKKIFYHTGVDLSQGNTEGSVDIIFKQLNDTLLDGMPCDHANSVISQKDDDILWKRNVCVHQNYWDAVNGDIHIYYLLREELLRGFVSEAGGTFTKIDDVTYQITK